MNLHLFLCVLCAGIFVSLTLPAQSCKTGKLHPDVSQFIKSMPPNDRSLAEMRKAINFEEYKIMGPPAIPYPAADVERIKITADSIPVMVFNPAHKTGLPIIINYHGGGFIQPIVPWMEHRFWYEATYYNAIVFAVDYRVAPEHKFPAAVDDAYIAFKWISEHGGRLGGDTSRIILSGNSAGANLVAVVSQQAKKEGIANKIKLQVMNCPVLDNPDNAGHYPSMQENAKGYFFTTNDVLFALETYADRKDYTNPRFAPLLERVFSGLPPAVMITAEFDPLRDQGIAYVEKLQKAGVKTWHKCFPGQLHVLIPFPSETPVYKELDAFVLNAMKEVVKSETK